MFNYLNNRQILAYAQNISDFAGPIFSKFSMIVETRKWG